MGDYRFRPGTWGRIIWDGVMNYSEYPKVAFGPSDNVVL